MAKIKKRGPAPAPLPVHPEADGPGRAADPLWRRVLREPIALGLVPLILARPLLDGATWPTDNFYFVWAILLLACVFLARMLMRGAEPRLKLATLLLGCFWLAGLMTLATTVQYSASYRSAVIWAGHFFLFLAVVNGVRSRTGITIVVTAVIASFLTETLYSFIHFNYILPMMRQMVMSDSYVLQTRLGGNADTAQLIHRLQTNRASGSLLFPNALAGFLILAIPITVAEMVQSFRAFARRRQQPVAPERSGEASPLAVTLTVSLTWLALVCITYFTVTLVLSMRAVAGGLKVIAWANSANWLPFAVFVVIAPVALAGGAAVALKRGGFPCLWLWTRVGVLPVLAVGEVWMLWLTYSRGGMLALVMAVVLVAAVLAGARRGFLRRRGAKAVPSAALLLLLAVVLAAFLAADTPAPAPTTQAAPAQAALAAPAQPGQVDTGDLTPQGRDMTVSDLASGATFRLRLSYWRTGIYMALDNFWTGVGWGNFGECYPNYRPAGAGAVTVAHNDYLQVLCETGILGFALFCSFWLYMAWWGLKRVLSEQDPTRRWELLGLYTGLLAVLAHSVIDFDFYDPSVAFFAFLAAGLLVSLGLLKEEESAPATSAALVKRRSIYQLVALPLLLMAALVAGMAFRVYLSDFIKSRGEFLGVGDDNTMETFFYEAKFFFPPPEETEKATKPRAIAVTHLSDLVPLRSALEAAGSFQVAGSKPGTMRRLRPDEPIPRDAAFVVSDFEKAKQHILPFADAWLAQLKDADTIFPYDAKLAAELVKWYDLLSRSLPDGETRRRCVLDSVTWAQETVRRSPREFGYRLMLGQALWMRANIETDSTTWRRIMDNGLAEFKTAAELFPSSGNVLRQYGNAKRNYGRTLRKAAQNATGKSSPEAEQMCTEAWQLIRRAGELETAELQF
ncbi:MAG: O-antigen ligase family protein [Candidatus Hydrogenedentes bacterium]|nr:O-antigen ligase family protein [Candidatus Hydrogenedentota bacterium]